MTGEALKVWNRARSQLQLLLNVKVPRCYFDLRKNPVEVPIYGYCDASETAYAAILYI